MLHYRTLAVKLYPSPVGPYGEGLAQMVLSVRSIKELLIKIFVQLMISIFYLS